MKSYQVAVVRGGPEDDSGPELMDAAMYVLESLLKEPGAPKFDFVPIEAGT